MQLKQNEINFRKRSITHLPALYCEDRLSQKGTSEKIRDADDIFSKKSRSFKSDNLRIPRRLPNLNVHNMPTFVSSQQSEIKRKIEEFHHQLSQVLKPISQLQQKSISLEKQLYEAETESKQMIIGMIYKENSHKLASIRQRASFLQRQILKFDKQLQELRNRKINQ